MIFLEITFSATLFLLVSVGRVGASCDPLNPQLCPPPFPDFMAIFSETLAKVPGLRSSLTAAVPGSSCLLSVNWTEFNGRLENGNPMSIDSFCSASTVSPLPSGRTNAGLLTTPSKTFTSRSSATNTTPEAEPISDNSDPGLKLKLGLAIGISLGCALLILIIIIVVIICRRRSQEKARDMQRGISQYSQAPLVNDSCYEPTTPGTPLPFDPMSDESIVKGIRLRSSICMESSTDSTIPRSKGSPHATLDEVIINCTKLETLEETDSRSQGCANPAYEPAEEELDDAGYAGSEVGQEVWENEMNVLFESAKMESNEDVTPTEVNSRRKDHHGSPKVDEPSHFLVPTTSERPKALFRLHSAEKQASLKLSLPSPVKDSASVFYQQSPIKATTEPYDSNSIKKAPIPSLTPSSSIKKSSISPPNSPTKSISSTSNSLSSGQVSSPYPTLTKPDMNHRLPSLPLSPEAPPAYSSPLYGTNQRVSFATKGREPSDDQVGTPTELPTYTQALALPGAIGSKTSSVAAQEKPSGSSGKQNRPLPPKKLSITETGKTTQKMPSALQNNESRPSPMKKSVSFENQVYGNPKVKQTPAVPEKSPKKESRVQSTAVIKPWNKSSTTDNNGTASRNSGTRPSVNNSEAPPPPPPPPPAEVAPSGESTNENYEFRPVRSLLSQFETAANQTRNSADDST